MRLPGTRGDQTREPLFDASGTITAGGTAQLLLPEHKSRAFLFIQNLHASAAMYIEIGPARATCAITSGAVTSFAIANAGFGYTYAPTVELLGGGNSGQAGYLGAAAPGYPAPGDPAYVASRFFDMSAQRPAKAHAVLTGNAVSSIVIDDPGAGYQTAPLVLLRNQLRDPFGAAIPSATSGIWLTAGGGNLYINGPVCFTDSVSIFSAQTGAAFCCKFSP